MKELIKRLRTSPLWNGSTLHAEAADLIESQAAEIDGLHKKIELIESAHYDAAFERDKYKALCDQMGAALKALWIAAPTDVECRNMHHPKPKQHRYDETCEVVSEYHEAITGAGVAIKAWRASK